jgi:hypothetical protein
VRVIRATAGGAGGLKSPCNGVARGVRGLALMQALKKAPGAGE